MFLGQKRYTKEQPIFENVDAYDGLNIIIEADQAWNDLNMRMMRLEHTAIVNEDVVLLEKGMKDWADKAANFFRNLYEKIKDFITAAMAKMVELTTKLKPVQEKLRKFNPNKAGEYVNVSDKYLKAELELVKKIASLEPTSNVGSNSQVQALLKVAKNADTSKPTELKPNAAIVKNADAFLFGGEREKAIGVLRDYVKDAKKTSAEGIKAAKEAAKKADSKVTKAVIGEKINAKKDELRAIQANASELTKHINSATMASLKVLRAASGGRQPKADKKAANESASILSYF